MTAGASDLWAQQDVVMLQGHVWEHGPDSAASQSAMQQALQGTLAVHTFSAAGEA